ncbi:site-specific DNA-methyltransferase [Enterococcus gallinarum]|uniref:site-specific DNA-methyltransferase n=1 Tax=Enterococcus TaxID=1350 RepID=UPI001AD7823A|nr:MULTISPECIES: site-specific DNA-methyltransferase [Enterococcus]MBO6332517.1 site-specific DNA-methyltransferase [Enterococcus gallinarum]MBO6353691.1 site-specific DNA-methyltransferase [Enterococcus gallinarum]MBO6395699.1 site-specific DNA-methyltransferase [Enterococcus gallinarum]MBO6423715.1 site-specific DNA-methyltransferase [Enterococcus gallinarum]MDT2030092.1 site-specific DNA-methyltransferase [Enterococcus faecalis]
MSNRPEKINLSDVHSRQVNIDLLNELRDLFVKAEEQKERYDFTWNGKAKAYFEAAAPTTKTLRAQPEESVDFEKSENLFITGDNLEALKLLQESYLGKIDIIYIDPPYNTGKDFVYQDDFKKTKKENDLSEGSIDEDGDRLVKNEKSNGRYHSDWLTMMYPRLKLARNLLSDTGVIFVSIDDNEQSNLKLLMDEIFGERNFIANIVQKHRSGVSNDKIISTNHNYLLFYAKNIVFSENRRDQFGLDRTEQDFKNYNKDDNDGLGVYTLNPVTGPGGARKGNPYYEFLGIKNYWRFSLDTMTKMYRDGKIVKINNTLYQKTYKKDMLDKRKGMTTWWDNFGTTSQGTAEIKKLFGSAVFDFPKPTTLIKSVIKFSGISKDGIILDFFAGSGTTADAVMQLNAKDGGNRKFIVATLDEETPESSEARKAEYTTIDQISRERIRRAAEKLDDKSGFRALKVDSTGLKEDVFKTAGELGQVDLLQDIDNHSDNRSDYDLLYDVLVDGALEYNRPITIDAMNNEKIIKYDYLGELSGVVCYFGENLTDELTRQIATLKPLLAVFKESTFDKSAQKVNVMEQFRIISPDTKVKVI